MQSFGERQFAKLQSPFWCELYYVVIANHQTMLQGINHQEQEMLAHLSATLDDDPNVLQSVLLAHSTVYVDIRKAQRNLALVGVVRGAPKWRGASRLPTEPAMFFRLPDRATRTCKCSQSDTM
jgi:hypothetical protein